MFRTPLFAKPRQQSVSILPSRSSPAPIRVVLLEYEKEPEVYTGRNSLSRRHVERKRVNKSRILQKGKYFAQYIQVLATS